MCPRHKIIWPLHRDWFQDFFRDLKSLASHLSEIYRCFFLHKTSTPVKALRFSSPTVHRLHKHRMSVWFCGAARLFSSSGPDSSDHRDLPLPAFIPVELWNMDLPAFSLALCVVFVFVFIFIKTSLYIIYLVLEHGKHLGQLQLLLNVLWNNQEYDRELQTAHTSFRMSAVWIYTLSVREGQQCKATNVEPFEWPFFWLHSCRLVQYLCQLVENLGIALLLTCLWLIDSWGSYHFSTVFHFNLIKVKFEI